jgi:glyoxylate reductase
MPTTVVFATSFLDELATHPEDEGRGKAILDELERSGLCSVEYRCQRDPRTPLKPEELEGVSAVVADLEVYSADLCAAVGPTHGGPLQLIARYGVGTNSVDLNAASENGIVVTNTPGANSVPTAEWGVATILAIAGRRIPHHERSSHGQLKAGPSRLDVSGRTLGVIGAGRVGRAVVDLLKGFNMRVIAYDPVRDEEWAAGAGVTYVAKEKVLAESDFITLHASATEQIIGSDELALIKPAAALVNCARGHLVDNRAAYQAVAEGKLFGYGLDEVWPYADLPLGGLNIAVSPHIGSDTDNGKARMQLLSAESVYDFCRGRRPEYVVNPETWEHRQSRT